MGQYTQVDSIGLAGGNPTLYGYVFNPLVDIDQFGLVSSGNICFISGLHPSSVSPSNPGGIFEIITTGNRPGDRRALLDAIGIDNPGRGWHAHHVTYNPTTNTMQMQLVDAKTHGSISHVGGMNDLQLNTRGCSLV